MPTESQCSDAVLMVRPSSFGFNPETAATNIFAGALASECALAAAAEFDRAVGQLAGAGVEVVVLEDTPDPAKPDAVFPNNWVSFHRNGHVVLYPMAVPSRRSERRAKALLDLLAARGFKVAELVDLSQQEDTGQVLEGTGSLVLDRPRRRAYAALGPRTSRDALAEFERRLGYSTMVFHATDRSGRPIYHTNVMLSLGTSFAMLCTGVVAGDERKRLVSDIQASGRTIIPVDYQQLRNFACNLLELRSSSGQPLIALSSSARSSLRADQLATLERLGGKLVEAAIPIIEAVGGGSLRCMIADIHLPRG